MFNERLSLSEVEKKYPHVWKVFLEMEKHYIRQMSPLYQNEMFQGARLCINKESLLPRAIIMEPEEGFVIYVEDMFVELEELLQEKGTLTLDAFVNVPEFAYNWNIPIERAHKYVYDNRKCTLIQMLGDGPDFEDLIQEIGSRLDILDAMEFFDNIYADDYGKSVFQLEMP